METVYWQDNEFDAANEKDVTLEGKKMKIRALSPEELIEFQAKLRAAGGAKSADDDPNKLKATFDQMKEVVKTATLVPSITDANVNKLRRLLVPLFNEIMTFSGMGADQGKRDEDFQ